MDARQEATVRDQIIALEARVTAIEQNMNPIPVPPSEKRAKTERDEREIKEAQQAGR